MAEQIDPFIWQGWVSKFNAMVGARRERRYRKFANCCVAIVVIEIFAAIVWIMYNG